MLLVARVLIGYELCSRRGGGIGVLCIYIHVHEGNVYQECFSLILPFWGPLEWVSARLLSLIECRSEKWPSAAGLMRCEKKNSTPCSAWLHRVRGRRMCHKKMCATRKIGIRCHPGAEGAIHERGSSLLNVRRQFVSGVRSTVFEIWIGFSLCPRSRGQIYSGQEKGALSSILAGSTNRDFDLRPSPPRGGVDTL